jgi:hypothetical protein
VEGRSDVAEGAVEGSPEEDGAEEGVEEARTDKEGTDEEGTEEEVTEEDGTEEGVTEEGGAEEEGTEEEGTAEEGAVEEDEVEVRMNVHSRRLLFFLSSSIALFSKSEHVVSSTVDSLGMFCMFLSTAESFSVCSALSPFQWSSHIIVMRKSHPTWCAITGERGDGRREERVTTEFRISHAGRHGNQQWKSITIK